MLCIEYDPELVEQAVRLAVRMDAARENELHSLIDPFHEIEDPDEREDRFRSAFAEWFSRLKLDRFVDGLVSGFPLLAERIDRVVVRAAPRRKSQGAELFVRGEDEGKPLRTLLIQLSPESMAESQRVHDLMLRELLHVEDMLDERFAYRPATIEGLPARRRAVLDRYRVLWDIYVESRLVRRGMLVGADSSRLRLSFEKAFTIAGQRPSPDAFESMWNLAHLTHAHLLAWAEDPKRLPGNVHRHGDGIGTRCAPGDACPLCGFPTFDWFEPSGGNDSSVLTAARASKPDWNPRDGLCRQCAEAILHRRREDLSSVAEDQG